MKTCTQHYALSPTTQRTSFTLIKTIIVWKSEIYKIKLFTHLLTLIFWEGLTGNPRYFLLGIVNEPWIQVVNTSLGQNGTYFQHDEVEQDQGKVTQDQEKVKQDQEEIWEVYFSLMDSLKCSPLRTFNSIVDLKFYWPPVVQHSGSEALWEAYYCCRGQN